MLNFNRSYFLIACVLFAAEVFIGVFVHDHIVRPYIGDFLVVILIYCSVRTFYQASVLITALAVLLFAYVIEVLQYFHLIVLLGLQSSKIANLILGNLFQWMDLVMYTIGILLVLFFERPSLQKIL